MYFGALNSKSQNIAMKDCLGKSEICVLIDIDFRDFLFAFATHENAEAWRVD